jgi:V/A-type H+-transporting ATPase subunit E
MPEELDHIIERIRSQGVEEAERRAEEILESARRQAGAMVDEARAEADRITAEAEEKARSVEKRGREALDQAARDLLLTVEEAVENIFEDLVHESVDKAMDEELVREMLLRVVEGSVSENGAEDVQVLLSPEDGKKLVEYFSARYKEKLDQGLELRTDSEVLRGFRISFRDRHVFLDYTSEAVAEALANFLRPRLAEIVICAAQVQSGVAEACREIGRRRGVKEEGE